MTDDTGTSALPCDYPVMMMYRFVTNRRAGKWYADLLTAQTQACAIGAGYLEARTGAFYQYPGTSLETRSIDDSDRGAHPGQQVQGIAA